MTILDIMRDRALFGSIFSHESWARWMVFLAALFGLDMTPEQVGICQEHTGRKTPPTKQASEGYLIKGRRAGGSFICALILVFQMLFRDWRPFLAPGEWAVGALVAVDRAQARVVMDYVRGLIHAVPMLERLITSEGREFIEFAERRVRIEIHTASFRTTRGRTFAIFIGDEFSFLPSEGSALPDFELVNAVKPGLASLPGSLLLVVSSPYARRGVLWDAYRRHYGQENAPLVWVGSTAHMNPRVPGDVIAAAYRDDPQAAAAEYGADFRRDVEAYIPREVIDACVVPDRQELPPLRGGRHVAFVDPSGGSQDSFTLAIAHRGDADRVVLDCVREIRAPFSPDDATAALASVLADFDCRTVTGDRYGGEWPRERFRKHGITYVVSEKTKSDLYREALPMLTAGRVELLENPRLINQLCSLERRTARGGRDSIDHPPRAHDDVANAVAGVLVAAAASSRMFGGTLKLKY